MGWWKRKQRDEDLERELRSHLEAEAIEARERGLSGEEAQFAAKRALGNITTLKESTRQRWRWNWLERLGQDVLYGLRTFALTPGFTAVVILTLALGIGSTSAIFSIVDAVLLNPLPYPDADRLVVVWDQRVREPKTPPYFDSYRDFQTFRDRSRSFAHLAPATWATGGHIFTGAGPARDVLAMPAGLDFFSLLGARAELGRTFGPDDLKQGCTVVLKYGFWITAFGGQQNITGKHIQLDQQACTVIGVMPRSFSFYPDALSMWLLITPGSAIAKDPENAKVGIFGLLKPGVSIEQAQKELELLYGNEHKGEKSGGLLAPVIYPLGDQFAYLTGPNLRLSVAVLFGAVTLVLLIACVNIANLLLGRSLTREKELAVRAALGSGRWRLIRQLLTEGLLLSCGGALVGILIAIGAVHFFKILNPIQLPPGNPVRVNLQVLGFTAALAVSTALLFGLIPALKASRVDMIASLRATSRLSSWGPAARLLGKSLVAAEVMLSLALLAGAGLLIDSVQRLGSMPLGFRADHLLTMDVELPAWSYAKAGRRARFYDEVLNRVRSFPGVESAAFATSLPLTGGRWRGTVLRVEGRPEGVANTAEDDVAQSSITSKYFQVMGVPLEAGRLFTAHDDPESEAVAIVNEALVRKYFPRETPIGQHIKLGEAGTDRPWLTIVGVAGNEKDKNFFDEMNWDDIPLVFRPVSQEMPSRGILVVRAARGEVELAAAIQRQISLFDSSVPIGEAQTMGHLLSRTLAYPKFRAALLAAFAIFAVLLANVGLYGVLSQLVTQRRQEFALREALGAQRHDVLAMVVRQGLLLTVFGLAAGLLLTLWLTKFLSSLLYGVKASDPWTLASASLLLLMVATAATLIPAWRGSRIDCAEALKYE
jgi:predicted permease